MQLPSQERHTAMSRSGHVLALYGGFVLVSLLISASWDDVDLYRLDEDRTLLQMFGNVFIGAGIGLSIVFLSRLAMRLEWARQLHRDFASLLGEQSSKEIFVLASASSVGEELLFRGALLPWLGIGWQALLFAALHVGPGRRYLPWTASALLLGIGFGYLVHWTGDLGAPIAAHFTINYLNLRFIVTTKLPES